jgi:radical SAM protein with 4Fe4S-binding SPASM domain
MTGGEPFVRKDFLDIYTHAKQKGILITLFTNGTLITSEIADHLAEWPPHCIEITLYGRSKQTYEKVTGVPGSFDRCMRGIDLIMERRLPLKLKTVALTINKHEIQDMKRFVKEDLKLEFRYDPLISPRCDHSFKPLDVRLSPAEIVEMDLADPERVDSFKQFAEKFNKPLDPKIPAGKLYRCGAGLRGFTVDPYGGMRICISSAGNAYDMCVGSLEQGWQKFIPEIRRQARTRTTKCSTCYLRSLCGTCPPNAELECHDAEEPVDFLCQVAHLRAYTMDLPMGPHGDCEYCPGGSRYEKMMEEVAKLKNRK